jgi:RNA polymerase sigma-70 factor (ECF subfamily)
MRGYALPAEADERRITGATDPDEAFDALYREYAPALRAYCRARLGKLVDAEDACHETILRAYKALPRFDSERRLWPWLATIAGNVCRDMQRRQATVAAHTTYVDVAVDDLDELTAARTRRAILADALEAMPERYRAHVVLRDFEGWSYEEIASFDGTSVASVRSTLHRARSVLRERVRDSAVRRREWPMPAFVPLVFSRLRARLARARTSAAASPVTDSLGRVSAFDNILALVAHPAVVHGVLSVAGLVGIGIIDAAGAAERYASNVVASIASFGGGDEVTTAASSSEGAESVRSERSDDSSATSEPSVDGGAPLADFSAPSDPATPELAPSAPEAPSTPDAPSVPTMEAPAAQAPPPPVHMTSGPEVSSPIDGSSDNYQVDSPTWTVDLPTAPRPIDPGDTTIEPCSPPSEDDGTVATLICSGQAPEAPAAPEPELSEEEPVAVLPESDSELTLI